MKSEQGPYGGRPPGMPGPFEGAPVTKWLLIINVAILFLQALMTNPGQQVFLQRFGHFSIQEGIYELQLWRFLTFQFLHADLSHLFMNGLGLLFFGPHIERWMSSRVFLTFYLLSGFAGAIFYTILFFLPGFFEGYHPSLCRALRHPRRLLLRRAECPRPTFLCDPSSDAHPRHHLLHLRKLCRHL